MPVVADLNMAIATDEEIKKATVIKHQVTVAQGGGIPRLLVKNIVVPLVVHYPRLQI